MAFSARLSARVGTCVVAAGMVWGQGYPQTDAGQAFSAGSPGGAQAPMPPRNPGKAKSSQPPVPLPSFSGTLKQMDEKSITLSMGDYRVLDFKRNSKTKFFRNGRELKAPDFRPGDQISIETARDALGYLNAVNVYWEKPASAVDGGQSQDGVVDAWAGVGEPGPARSRAEAQPPAAAPANDDPGPPTLRRGRPADPSRGRSAAIPEQPAAAAAQPAPALPAMRPDDDLSFGSRPLDPVIRKAADAALEFVETLPNYICREVITRFESVSKPVAWKSLDVVTAEVVYEQGKERYRNLTIDGKPTEKGLAESGGAWSTGEFASVLINLFSPATAAEFHYSKESRIQGIDAKAYAFTVARENSHWAINMGAQSYKPAYSGTVWIDPLTFRALRIEMRADDFPVGFPIGQVESAIDYDYVRLGGTRPYLLPVHAETQSCERSSSYCSRHAIEFREYHKFEGQSTIEYGDVKQ